MMTILHLFLSEIVSINSLLLLTLLFHQDQESAIDGGPVGASDISFGKPSEQSSPTIEAYIDEVKIFNNILPVSVCVNREREIQRKR